MTLIKQQLGVECDSTWAIPEPIRPPPITVTWLTAEETADLENLLVNVENGRDILRN